MSKVDEELARRLRAAERPVDVEELFVGLERRRAHRRRVRGIQIGALAVVMLIVTAAAFAALTNVFGNQATDVGTPPLPANGEIVFSVSFHEEGSTHLYAIDPHDFEERQITDLHSDDTDPAVSPDGRTIAFVHQPTGQSPEIATIPLAGGEITRLTDDPIFVTSGPSWSPDGSQLAFATQDDQGQRLLVMNADGTDLRAVTTPDLYWVAGAAWSPDGARIAFTASRASGDVEPSRWDLYTIEPDGTGLVRLTNTPTPDADESSPTWSPDGERLALARSDTRGNSWLVILDLTDGLETRLTDGSSIDLSPSWSPDGTILAFERSRGSRGPTDVWLIQPDGSDLRPITGPTTGLGESEPTWQPIPADGIAPTSSPSRSAEGRDVGLGAAMCNLQALDGIDWYGDGTSGTAWTGSRATPDGRCPEENTGEYIVVADLDGDGVAEPGGIGFLAHCLLCRPYAAADLDGNGVLELVVLEEASSTQSYSFFEVSRPTSERSPGIYNLFVAPPGHPEARVKAGEPLRIDSGGDEGYSAQIRCLWNGPEGRELGWAWSLEPVDAAGEKEVHVLRIQLHDDGLFHVVGVEEYSVPAGASTGLEPPPSPTCGVDWNP